ncbi:MAG: hypothetical protein ACE5G2_10425, partial [Candidatus Krumholzibacteriia bacterium]
PSLVARRSSLAGNLLIPDRDDIFFFPHEVAEYQRTVTFDLGSSSSVGSGGMIIGNESISLGAFSHRSDFLGAIANAFFTEGDIDNVDDAGSNMFPTPFGPLFETGPDDGALQWFDFVLGWSYRDMPLGLRVSLGRNEDDPVDPDAQKDVTTVNAVLGLGLNDIDLSAEISFAQAETQDSAMVREAKPTSFAFGARSVPSGEGEDLSFGWVGVFSFANGGFEARPEGGTFEETNVHQLAVALGAGPVYRPHDRTVVAMYGTFEWMRSETEQPSGDEVTMNRFVVPGWHIAAEIEASSWLQVRAGMRSRLFLNDTENKPVGGEVTQEESISLDFRWTAGVGIELGELQIDGFLDPAVITSGSDLFGDSSQVFGLVTASYAF